MSSITPSLSNTQSDCCEQPRAHTTNARYASFKQKVANGNYNITANKNPNTCSYTDKSNNRTI